MKKQAFCHGLAFIFTLAFLLSACVSDSGSKDSTFELDNSTQLQFIDNLSKFCGQSFLGEQTYIAPGRESWEDKEMTIHFSECSKGKLAIAFWLGGDQSRTWLLLEEEGKLRFRHDHRHVDGTPEDVTLYGGYADEKGSSNKQTFPADDYTCKMLPNACNAEWQLELTEKSKFLSYSLFNHGELLFSAQFNLSEPLNQ